MPRTHVSGPVLLGSLAAATVVAALVPASASERTMPVPEVRGYALSRDADAFHPTDGWVDPDVIGIDLGITLLTAETLRTGDVWRWFMAHDAIPRGLRRAGMTRVTLC